MCNSSIYLSITSDGDQVFFTYRDLQRVFFMFLRPHQRLVDH